MRDMEKYRAYQREYQRRYRSERYAKMIEFLGGKCAVCGTVENLEIHHKDPNSKEFDPGSKMRPWSVALVELAKCELLCFDHHHEFHNKIVDARSSVHGRAHMYRKHGCRCEACVEAYREWKCAADQRYQEKNYAKMRLRQRSYYQENRETIRRKQNEKRREQNNACV